MFIDLNYNVNCICFRNWDGAPPRYQNTPHAPPMTGSEYERPPPYYFPGAPSEAE